MKLSKVFYSRLFSLGLTISLAFYGFTYFQSKLYETTYEKISGNFIVNTFAAVISPYLFYFGLVLVLIGLIGLIRTCYNFKELRISIGKALYFPPLLGFIVFITLQLYAQNLAVSLIDFSPFVNLSTYLDPQFILSVIIFILGIILSRK